MLQVAAAFSGGLYIKQKLEEVQLPRLSKAGADGVIFTLSVRVLAASVPGLAQPGFWSHHRPFLEGTLGKAKKETEFADFAADGAGPYAEECKWRFGDSLTFKIRPEDVAGAGLKLHLKVRKDIVLGPVQFEMKAESVGEGALCLRDRIMPACVQERRDDVRGGGRWASPVMLVPLAHVPDGMCGQDCQLGEPVAHVAVLFSMDCDPEPILEVVRPASITKQMEDRVGGMKRWIGEKVDKGVAAVENKGQDKLDGFTRWLDKPSTLEKVEQGVKGRRALPGPQAGLDLQVAAAPTPQQAHSAPAQRSPESRRQPPEQCRRPEPIPELGQELEEIPEEWGSSPPTQAQQTPPERRCHGLAPECPQGGGYGGGSSALRGQPAVLRTRTEVGPSPLEQRESFAWGPDLSPEGWKSFTQPNSGRTMWHHQDLGPAPWELAEQILGMSPGRRPPPSPGDFDAPPPSSSSSLAARRMAASGVGPSPGSKLGRGPSMSQEIGPGVLTLA